MIASIKSSINNRKVSLDFFIIYRVLLGSLALLHTMWFFRENYPFYVHVEDYVQIPIIETLVWVPKILHTSIYFLMLFASFAILLNKHLQKSLAYIALALLYTEFHNYFAFHQDIFLGAIIFFFSIFIFNKEEDKSLTSTAIFFIQSAVVILYVCAGINKFNDDFLSGYVIADILEKSFIWKRILGSHINNDALMLSIGQFSCYFSFIIELLFPILVIFKRTRNIAIVLGIMLHLGIETTGRGMLFNLYLPAMYLLWYSNVKFPVMINRDGILLNKQSNKILCLISLPLISLYLFHLLWVSAATFKHLLIYIQNA